MQATEKTIEERKETYLTLVETGEYLRVSPRTVYRWLDAGMLKFFRVGKSTRIALSDLEEFIANNSEGGKEN